MENQLRSKARQRLDERLSELKPEDRFKAPPKGWIRAIREALGMTGVQLADRMGVSPQSINALEMSEANGTVQLNTLRRAANELECTLVYALVPKTSLEGAVGQRARKIASRELARVAHTMKLESQETDHADIEARTETYIRNSLEGARPLEREVTDLFREPDDATPLAPEEREGLKQSWITHRRDLNEAEEENILKGSAWAHHRRGLKATDLLDETFSIVLHKRMFGDVWKWAGSYRKTERNIGIEAYRIAVEVRNMFDDVKYWVVHATIRPMKSRCACITGSWQFIRSRMEMAGTQD